MGLLRPTPTLQEPRQAGQPPSSSGRVYAQGVKSWGGSFIWNGVLFGAAEPWIAYAAAVPKREVLCCRSADGLPDPAGFLRQTVRGKIPNRAF